MANALGEKKLKKKMASNNINRATGVAVNSGILGSPGTSGSPPGILTANSNTGIISNINNMVWNNSITESNVINVVKEITGQNIYFIKNDPMFIWDEKKKVVVTNYIGSAPSHYKNVTAVPIYMKDEDLPNFLKENEDNYLVFYLNRETGSIFHSSDTYTCTHCGTQNIPSQIPRHIRVYIHINQRKTKLKKLNELEA